MNKTCLSLICKGTLLVCSMLLANLSLVALDLSKESSEPVQHTDPDVINALKQQNIQHARELLQTLYVVSLEDFSNLLDKKDSEVELGVQAGYYGKEGTDQAYSPLVLYRRVWVYDAGIALTLAVQNNDPTAGPRALWLLKNGQYTRDPQNPSTPLFAGWPFSSNQRNYGDNWTDCRFVTGANASALLAIARYITSDYYLGSEDKLKSEYKRLYRDGLSGILYHMETDGPNEDLITAGWSLNVLEEFSKTGYSYNKVLDMLGYGPREIEGFSEPIQRVRVRNVVTEHCSNVLELLNYTLRHYDRLFEKDRPYTYDELDAIRVKLRKSIYNKLYDNSKRRFITGRSASGEPSAYSAIDNASWLCTSLDLDALNDEQTKALSDSLVYTINNFTKDFIIAEKTYFGAHYFEEGFEDPYGEKSDADAEEFHVEGTCGLICGLLEFAKAFPDDPNAAMFRVTASELWNSMQRFLADFGFVYTSSFVKGTAEPIEASAPAIWYLHTCNYLENAQ